MAGLYKYKYNEDYSKKANGVNKIINCPTATADMIRHVMYLQPYTVVRDVLMMNGHEPMEDIITFSEAMWRLNKEKRQIDLEHANENTAQAMKWKKEHGLIKPSKRKTA